MASSTGFPTADTPVSNNLSSNPVVGSPVFQHPFQTTPSPAPNYRHPSYPTPSPIRSVSVIHSEFFDWKKSNLVLRVLAFFFASASSITTAATTTAVSFSVFRYFISASIVTSIYSGIQVFTSIRETSNFEGLFFSEKTWDYTTFILDQVVAYFLMSSLSVAALATEGIERGTMKTEEVVSICLLSVAFVFVTICSLMSGFSLCKRIMW